MDPSGAPPAPDANKQLASQPEPGVPAAAPLATPPAAAVAAAPAVKPEAPAPHTETGASAHIDLGKILLPKKEIHSSDSAQRVNAGALLDQELTAGVEGIPAEQKTPAPAPIARPAAKNPSSVQALETFQGDIADLVQRKNVSAVSIATAEANRRGTSGGGAEQSGSGFGLRMLFFFVGALLVAGASGLIGYVFLLPRTAPIQTAPQTPYIAVDATIPVALSLQEPRSDLMQALTAAKDNARLSLGLVGRLDPVTNVAATQLPEEMDAQTLLSTLAPELTDQFLRSLRPVFLLGVYSYADAEPFLILKTDSYEQAYSGMLAWEGTMRQDLVPLFSYTPSPHLAPVPAPSAVGSSTAATSTSQTLATSTPSVLPAGFVDQVVENHDARVLETGQGDIVLLWTFLDRNTIVITTTDAVLREVIARIKDAPVIPLVGK